MSADIPGPSDRYISDALAFAEGITQFPTELLDPPEKYQTLEYLLSNDNNLGVSYARAFQEYNARPAPDKQGAVLIVGNGSIETARQLFPDSLVAMVDKNPVGLKFQEHIYQTLREEDTPQGYLASMTEHAKHELPLVRHLKSDPPVPLDMSLHYTWQANEWLAGSSGTGARFTLPPHFLQDQDAYDAARSAHRVPPAFRLIDLSDMEQVAKLADDLRQHNAEIVCANLTNICDSEWLGRVTALELVDTLPFSEHGVVMDSITNLTIMDPIRSRPYSVQQWQRAVTSEARSHDELPPSS